MNLILPERGFEVKGVGMIRFAVLGSGSSGNCSVISLGETHVLIDIGLSARQVEQRLETLGLDPGKISAVVLTHEHSDHTGGLDVFLRKRPGLEVYATTHTAALIREGLRTQPRWRVFHAGGGFEVGGFTVESFNVPHDAVDPVGFVFRGAGMALGSLSDTGHVTHLIRERLRGLDALHVEANYDEMLLQNDRKRPWATKQRISSRHGHLSNAQAAELISAVACERLRWVVLNHLSRDCNNARLAGDEISRALVARGLSRVGVHCACQRQPLPFLTLSPPVPPSPEPKVPGQPHHRPPEDRVRETPAFGQPPDKAYVQEEWQF